MNKTLRNVLAICCAVVFLAAAIIVVVVVCGRGEKTVEPGPETGMYYYDADDGDTYYITLSDGDKVAMQVKGARLSGRYALENGSFTFTLGTGAAVSATYADNVVNLTYEGSSMRFLRTESYTVTFDTNGGSAVEPVKVMNGKTVAKPADPTREGYAFLGWYADSAYTTAFSFGAAPVTANTTVYARWSEKLTGAAVYTVDFDLNYAGAEQLDSVQTVGGRIYNVPTPTREGYTFSGWWISDYEDANKLTYRYDDNSFDANTTLFALWESASSSKLATPTPRVEGDSVVWDPVTGVSTYEVEITGPNGNTLVSQRTGSTSVAARFSSAVAGEYRIRVRAVASNEANSSDTAVRYYNNKALARVSLFSVIEPSVLLFNAVEGAENYKISVVCGNSSHNHTDFDNGTSTYFSFANCEMAENGIAFTVTASATGRASSTSKTFYYNRVLDKIEAFYFEDETETVRWDAVPNAADYAVKITAGSDVYEYETNGKTYVSLKGYAAANIQVSVTPITAGYNSPAAGEYAYARTRLAAPTGLKVVGNKLSWNAAADAASYTVEIDGREYTGVTETEYDLSALALTNGVDYAISVKAVGATSSVWSDAITVQYYSLSPEIVYSSNTVYWNHVIGAVTYKIKVNDGEPFSVDAGASSAPVKLTKKGVNTISVQVVDDMGTVSDWQSVTVYAYEMAFDAREGSAVETAYLAMGDTVSLPETVRDGFELNGWYNVPGAAQANGAKFADGSRFSAVGDVVLYANWTPNTYTVTYVTSEDEELDRESDTVVYTGDYQLAVPTTSDTSKTFVGWYSEPDGQGTQFTDSEGYSVAPWTLMEDQNVYPYWIEIFKFTLQTEGTYKDTYSVVATNLVSRVSKVIVPATYRDRPVTIIEGYAFNRSTTLRTIEIPNTIKIVYTENAFEGCTSLQAVNVYNAGAAVPLYSSANGVLYLTSEVAEEGKTLVFAPAALTGNYVVPGDVKAIGRKAFAGSKLTSVTIPSSVSSIGIYAFQDCANLSEVNFDLDFDAETDTELKIEESAFAGCKKLTSLTLPARLKTFDPAIVGDSTMFENLYVADDHEIYSSVNGLLCNKAGDTIIYCPTARRGALRIPTGIRAIGKEAFKNCTNIRTLVIPSFVKTIGESAFAGCTRLVTVTFAGGNSLGDELTIGTSAFEGCVNLSGLIFAENSNVVSFGDSSFSGCTKLTSLSIPATVKELTPGSFVGMQLANITVDAANPYYTAENSVLFNKDKTSLIYYSPYLSATEYILPNTVKSIEANSFAGNLILTKIVLGGQLEKIGTNAFYESTALRQVVFVRPAAGSQTILTIETSAFESCASLRYLYVTDSADADADTYVLGTPSSLRTISNRAFYGSMITSLVLSEGVETIGEYAFSHSSTGRIMSLELPASLKTISANAFSGNRFLSDVTIAENSQLETIGEYAFSRTSIVSFCVPKTVTLIGRSAFSAADLSEGFTFEEGRTETITLGESLFSSTELTSITFPDLCEFYGESRGWMVTPIDGATNLQEINNIPAHEKYAYYDGAFYVHEDGVLRTLDHAVLGNHDYVIPNTVTRIESGAFNSSVTGTVTFAADGDEDLVIAEAAFNNSSLSSIVLPARLRAFEGTTSVSAEYNDNFDGAFAYSKLETVIFEDTDEHPSRLESIPNETFRFMANLTGIEIPRNVKTIGFRAFTPSWNGTELASITLHEGLEEIGGYAFSDDFGDAEPLYTSLHIPSTVRYIGDYAFAFATSLTEIVFDKDEKGECALEILGRSAFRFAAITEITLPKSLAGSEYENDKPNGKLAGILFYGCRSLKTVVFEDGCPLITAYDGFVFASCDSYTDVTFPDNVTSIGQWEYNSLGTIKTITIPAGFDEESLTNIAPSLIGLNVGGFKLAEGNVNLYQDGEEGAIYNLEKTRLIYYPNCYTAESYTVLPSTVEIAPQAFYENKRLKTVILPEGLETIGEEAFSVSNEASSSALESITIPSTVKRIGRAAFFSATKLTELIFATDENGNSALTEISNQAFRHCTSLTEVVLPDSLHTLGVATSSWHDRPDSAASVFYECTSLETIVLSNSMSEIPSQTFGLCTSLKNVVIKQNSALNRIAQYAFNGSGLERIDLTNADALTEISDYAFINSNQLKEIIFSTDTTQEISIGNYSFAGTAFESFNLIANIISIGDYAFQGVSTLTDVTVAEGSKLEKIGNYAFSDAQLSGFAFERTTLLESIGNYAFYEQLGLTEVLLPDSVESVGDYAFYGCENVAEFKLSQSISSIGRYAFAKLRLIEAITIYGNNTVVGAGAFEDCSSLAEITILTGVDSLGNSAFGFTAITTLTLPETLSSLEGNPFAGCPLESLEILSPDADFFFDDEHKTLFNADKTLLYYVSTTASGVYVLDETVTSIMAGAFAGSQITSITLPAQFTAIADGTFRNCTKLESITIGKNITSIGAFAFEGCTSLASVNFEQGGTRGLAIGEGAFKGCTALKTVELPHRLRNTTRIEIEIWDFFDPPIEIEKTFATPGLGAYAFENSGLVSVTYEKEPSQEISTDAYNRETLAMGTGVFRNCVDLETVEFDHQLSDGQYDEWDETGWCIGDYAFYGCTKLRSVTLQEFSGTEQTYSDSGWSNYTSTVGSYAFTGCTSLTSFEVPCYLRNFNAYCFSNSGLTSMTLPYFEDTDDWSDTGALTYYIQEGAFAYCTNLKTFEALGPVGSVTNDATPEIGRYVLKGCTSLEKAVFTDIYAIMESGFEDCVSLKEVSMHFVRRSYYCEATGSALWLDRNMFKNCQSLTTVTLTGDLEVIRDGAFADCSSIAEITIPDRVKQISGTAFQGWTAAQKIKVYYAGPDWLPGAWAPGWSADATIVYLTASEA